MIIAQFQYSWLKRQTCDDISREVIPRSLQTAGSQNPLVGNQTHQCPLVLLNNTLSTIWNNNKPGFQIYQQLSSNFWSLITIFITHLSKIKLKNYQPVAYGHKAKKLIYLTKHSAIQHQTCNNNRINILYAAFVNSDNGALFRQGQYSSKHSKYTPGRSCDTKNWKGLYCLIIFLIFPWFDISINVLH